MLIQAGVRLIPRRLWNDRGSITLMAVNKMVMSSPRFCGNTPWGGEHHQRYRSHMAIYGGCGSAIGVGNALRLKSCLDRHDGTVRRVDSEIGKARVVAPYRQFVHESETVLGEEVGTKLVNGCSLSKPGSPLGFIDQLVPNKLAVAVDVDEGREQGPCC